MALTALGEIFGLRGNLGASITTNQRLNIYTHNSVILRLGKLIVELFPHLLAMALI